MAPPSKKQKWRQLDLSATEQYMDDAVLHQRVAQLEASDSLYQIDTSGCAPVANLTQRARRLLQQKLLAADGSGGEGAVLRTATQPKTLKVVPKKPLLQVISAQHKKQLRKFIMRQQEKEKRSSAQSQTQHHSSEAGAPGSWTRLQRASTPCNNAGGGVRAGHVEDLWPAEDASCAVRTTSPPFLEKEGETGEADTRNKRRSELADGDAAASGSCDRGAPLLHERQLEDTPACTPPLETGQQQRQTRRKRGRSTDQQEKTVAEPSAATAVRTVTNEGSVVTAGEAPAEAKNGKVAATQGVAEGCTTGGGRRHTPVDFPKKLTARALRSFDSLRPYVPVVRLPGDCESYNPSSEASACGLLAAAVRTLEEQREVQKLQRCSTRSSVTQQAQQQQDREKLELLLLANLQQQELDQQGARRFRCPVQNETAPQTEKGQIEEAQEVSENGQQQRQQDYSRMQRVDQVLGTVLPPEEVKLLSDTQKQRVLLDLVYKGKMSSSVCEDVSGAQSPATNGLQQHLRATESQQQLHRDTHDTKPLSSSASAAGTGHEETGSDEGDDAARNCASLSRAKQREKKTRAERNRRLRFLQQQRRHAAKVAARSWRAAVDRVDVAVQQLEAEEAELARRQKEREGKLRAKILAAKQGQVRLKIGRVYISHEACVSGKARINPCFRRCGPVFELPSIEPRRSSGLLKNSGAHVEASRAFCNRTAAGLLHLLLFYLLLILLLLLLLLPFFLLVLLPRLPCHIHLLLLLLVLALLLLLLLLLLLPP